MKRLIWHWTAGAHNPNATDREHYHFLIDGAGEIHRGDHTPEDNLDCTDDRYAAHTSGTNTGSIGVSLCAMAGAQERPFDPGRYPVTPAQVEALAALTATLCRRYAIPVTPRTVLSHAEVQPTLGIRQNGKWDFAWLPGMAAPGNPVDVGNRLRAKVRDWMTPEEQAAAFVERPASWWQRWFGFNWRDWL